MFKKKNGKIGKIAVLMSLVLVSSAACAKTPPAEPAEPAVAISKGIYTAGTYSASEKGFGGTIEVSVTVDTEKILSVEVKGDKETQDVGGKAVQELSSVIVAANGTNVDAVSGATESSTAIKTAVDNALAQARGEAPAATPAAALAFKPGTYTGKGTGYYGAVELGVTFTENAISKIEVVNSSETEHIGDSAYAILFPLIQEYTSTGVDAVSGATFTSKAVFAAVEDAATQAGSDSKAIQTGAKPYAVTAGEKITGTYDVVIVGAGGAGMSAAAMAAQNGSTVLVIEKMAEMGGNTLASGGQFQGVQESLVWDPKNPEATEAVYDVTGETVTKVKSDTGRIDTLRMIDGWKETPFDGAIVDAAAIKNVNDYDLPNRGVHAEFLGTLQTLKSQIKEYLAYADKHLAAGEKETDLTLFSTVELYIFQTYYGGLRLNAEKDEWIYNDFDLVNQVCTGAVEIKPWLIAQGAAFDNTKQPTLIGSMWQRLNVFSGGTVDGVEYKGKWGSYFKVPENTLLKANSANNIMYRTTAKELITDGKNVVGVKAVQFDGTEVEITATKGVILATGGYGANIKMVEETNDYWSTDDLTPQIKTTNRNLAQGEGILMGQAVGATVVGMGFTQLMPLGWVDNGNLAYGSGESVIYISPAGTENAGKRYVDETSERDVLSQAAYDNGDKDGFYVEISNSGLTGDAGKVHGDVEVEGRRYFRDLDGAAQLLGIDKAVLEKTITDYDQYIIGKSTTAPQPGKAAYRDTIGNCEKDAQGHYLPDTYKIDKIQIRYLAPSTHHTMGGLVVDTDRHVLDADGNVIKGLYAAGEVTGGIFAGNRLGGNAITEIIVSGRIAGQAASEGK